MKAKAASARCSQAGSSKTALALAIGAGAQGRLLIGGQQGLLVQAVQHRMAFPVAAVGHAVGEPEGSGIGVEHAIDLGCLPDIILALLALAVGIQARGEGVFDQHLPLEPADRLARPRREERTARVCRNVCQQRQQLGVVVEHLLEMRHQPQGVDRIAREAAAEMVVDAALADVGERVDDRLPHGGIAAGASLAPEELQQGRLGEFRCAAEPAMDCIKCLSEPGRGSVGETFGERAARVGPREALQRILERAGVAVDLVALLAPDLADAVQHVRQARPAVARFRWEVGAAPERLAGGREEHGERPAALLAEQGQGMLVDLVEVGPLLAIDLDVDEVAVHQGGDLGVLEALVRHHMAPVAGGIADRKEDRLVLLPGGGECGLVPRLPVHRVVLVLEQVRAGGFGEAVAHATNPGASAARLRRPGGDRGRGRIAI